MILNESFAPLVTGHISVCDIQYRRQDRQHPRLVTPLFHQPNQIQAGWGAIFAQLLLGNREYAINTIYIEFENVASAGDPVTPPTFTNTEGAEYYTDLSLSASRDFIRAPLILNPDLGVADGFASIFDGIANGNKLTYFTQSQGSVGYHGKTYSNAVNSKVFGVALVAAPDQQDQTADLVAARTYFETANQTVKQASSQIGIVWDLSFKV